MAPKPSEKERLRASASPPTPHDPSPTRLLGVGVGHVPYVQDGVRLLKSGHALQCHPGVDGLAEVPDNSEGRGLQWRGRGPKREHVACFAAIEVANGVEVGGAWVQSVDGDHVDGGGCVQAKLVAVEGVRAFFPAVVGDE